MKVHRITLNICEACLNAEGSECHTPGCVFCFQNPPKEPIRRMLIKIMDTWEEV